jgi:hypothetical protein
MCGSLVTYRQSEMHRLEKHRPLPASLKEMCLFFFISTKMSQSPRAWNQRNESERWICAANDGLVATRRAASSPRKNSNQFRCSLRAMVYSLMARSAHDL